MSEHQQAPVEGFGPFLLRAMAAAGFRTPTALAREAGLSPSVILRWTRDEVVPSVRVLQQVAPLLNIDAAELIARAYPNGTPRDPGAPPPREIARLAVKPAFTLGREEEQTVVVTDQALRLSWLCTSGMFETRHMLELAEAVEAVMRLRMPFDPPEPSGLPQSSDRHGSVRQ